MHNKQAGFASARRCLLDAAGSSGLYLTAARLVK
jgi:hypothetical protein